VSDDIERQRLIDFDRTLKPGLCVEARWHHGKPYTAKATVRSISRDTVTAVLDEDRDDPFHAGWPVKLPRFLKPGWSVGAGVFPLALAKVEAAPYDGEMPGGRPPSRRRSAGPQAELYKRLVKLTEESSQNQVAGEIGIPHEHLWRILKGERSPSIKTLTKIYEAYPRQFKELKIFREPKKS
jgi:hypothetical protein